MNQLRVWEGTEEKEAKRRELLEEMKQRDPMVYLDPYMTNSPVYWKGLKVAKTKFPILLSTTTTYYGCRMVELRFSLVRVVDLIVENRCLKDEIFNFIIEREDKIPTGELTGDDLNHFVALLPINSS